MWWREAYQDPQAKQSRANVMKQEEAHLLWITAQRLRCWEAPEKWGERKWGQRGKHRPISDMGCDNEEFGFNSEGEVKLFRILKREMAESFKSSLTSNFCLDHSFLTYSQGWHCLINNTSHGTQRGEEGHWINPSPINPPLSGSVILKCVY